MIKAHPSIHLSINKPQLPVFSPLNHHPHQSSSASSSPKPAPPPLPSITPISHPRPEILLLFKYSSSATVVPRQPQSDRQPFYPPSLASSSVPPATPTAPPPPPRSQLSSSSRRQSDPVATSAVPRGQCFSHQGKMTPAAHPRRQNLTGNTRSNSTC